MNPDHTYLPVHSGPLPHPWGAPPGKKKKEKGGEKGSGGKKKKRKKGVCCSYLHWRMAHGQTRICQPLRKK